MKTFTLHKLEQRLIYVTMKAFYKCDSESFIEIGSWRPHVMRDISFEFDF